MKRWLSVVAVCLLSILLVPQASAQVQPNRCPGPITPEHLLNNSTWVYQIEGVSYWGSAAAGQFTARISAATAGPPARPALRTLDVIDSSSIVIVTPGGGSPLPPNAGLPLLSRLQPYNGRWEVNADCSGGTLFLNSNLNPAAQYDFWYSNALFTEMKLVSVEIGRVFVGTATRVGPLPISN